MYPEHDDTWLNGRQVTGPEARTVNEARQAARDRLLGGITTTADRPDVVPYQVSAEETVTLNASGGVL